MRILTLIPGESSLKYSLYNTDNELPVTMGEFERIGLEGSKYSILYNDENIVEEIDITDFDIAINMLLDKLVNLDFIHNYEDIKCVSHKILHGREIYRNSTIISKDVVEDLRGFIDLYKDIEINIKCIEAIWNKFEMVTQVGVFDTGFYMDIEKNNYLYPVPYDWYEKYSIRKYGFNGIRNRFITNKVSELTGKKDIKLVSCLLGSDTCISAIKDGKCVDTSMGFSTLDGAVMGTRSGVIDPTIVTYIMEKEGKNALEVLDDLNTQSGLLGLSEFSSKLSDIMENPNEKTNIAKDKYVRRIIDYIASYYLLLDGIDVIVLSGNIGINNIDLRRELFSKLEILGVKIDNDKINHVDELIKISSDDSKIQVYVIPYEEESIILEDTLNLVRNG